MEEDLQGDTVTSNEGTPHRATVQSLPSDYSDVEPQNYDPEFISRISNSMQVPDKIPAVDGLSDADQNRNNSNTAWDRWSGGGQQMTVPDRIFIGAGGEHIGGKHDVRDLNFDFPAQTRGSNNYVGLRTPPHTLTMDEQFPTVEDEVVVDDRITPRPVHVANGNVRQPVPYTPGMSTDESLLLNDEDETTLVRTQVAKLTRRVGTLEVELQNRSHREMMLYPVVLGYFVLKIFWWMFKSKD